ncbi:hypothetical protein PybrP1_006903 [[Pythium] brassicae (nom. inval.)]|nr:hypothetical protein PybrP1_006903 [[Pythium] brassicae (nom. inval.)]
MSERHQPPQPPPTAATVVTAAKTIAARRLPRLSETRGPPAFQANVKMALHQQLLTAGERRRVVNLKHEFLDVVHQENGAPKSMKVFKGEAKDILYGIFIVLLLRFLLALAVVLGAIGGLGLLVVLLKHPDATFASYARSYFQ